MADVDPVHDPLSPTQKPSWKSGEFWIGALVTLMSVGSALIETFKDENVAGALSGLQGKGVLAGLIGLVALLVTVVPRFLLKLKANEHTAKAAAIIATAQPSGPQ